MQYNRQASFGGRRPIKTPNRLSLRGTDESPPNRSGLGNPVFSFQKSPLRNSGFSLLELMVCIGILTTGIIFIVEIFGSMLNASTKGADWSVATYLAASELDKMVYSPGQLNFVIQNSTGNVYQGPPYNYHPGTYEPIGVASLNKTTYYITDTVREIKKNGTRALYQVDVRVDWFVPSPPDSNVMPLTQGYGKLSTKLSRLIYVH